jgi:hypothetical protein
MDLAHQPLACTPGHDDNSNDIFNSAIETGMGGLVITRTEVEGAFRQCRLDVTKNGDSKHKSVAWNWRRWWTLSVMVRFESLRRWDGRTDGPRLSVGCCSRH